MQYSLENCYSFSLSLSPFLSVDYVWSVSRLNIDCKYVCNTMYHTDLVSTIAMRIGHVFFLTASEFFHCI